MTVLKIATTTPGLSDAIHDAYSKAGEFLRGAGQYNLGIEDAAVGIESIDIDGKPTLHVAFAWNLDSAPEESIANPNPGERNET